MRIPILVYVCLVLSGCGEDTRPPSGAAPAAVGTEPSSGPPAADIPEKLVPIIEGIESADPAVRRTTLECLLARTCEPADAVVVPALLEVVYDGDLTILQDSRVAILRTGDLELRSFGRSALEAMSPEAAAFAVPLLATALVREDRLAKPQIAALLGTLAPQMLLDTLVSVNPETTV